VFVNEEVELLTNLHYFNVISEKETGPPQKTGAGFLCMKNNSDFSYGSSHPLSPFLSGGTS